MKRKSARRKSATSNFWHMQSVCCPKAAYVKEATMCVYFFLWTYEDAKQLQEWLMVFHVSHKIIYMQHSLQ
jgi:hypothetical protein